MKQHPPYLLALAPVTPNPKPFGMIDTVAALAIFVGGVFFGMGARRWRAAGGWNRGSADTWEAHVTGHWHVPYLPLEDTYTFETDDDDADEAEDYARRLGEDLAWLADCEDVFTPEINTVEVRHIEGPKRRSIRGSRQITCTGTALASLRGYATASTPVEASGPTEEETEQRLWQVAADADHDYGEYESQHDDEEILDIDEIACRGRRSIRQNR